jgi:EmrB/QacA subfamily drug resistance transporter
VPAANAAAARFVSKLEGLMTEQAGTLRPTVDPEARGRRLTLGATVIGSSLAFIDASVVLVGLPAIGEDLELGLSGQQWVVLSYSLALAALYLVGGAIGDRIGRREVFIAGIVGFAAASALAGAAPNGSILILARALQGVFGAFVTTNSLALLRAVYGPDSGHAIGLWTSFTGVATIAGPPLGGALVEYASWRWVFFINLPLALLAVVLARAGRCGERERPVSRRLDVPGAALVAVGLGFLTYGLVQGQEDGFAEVWWTFAIAAGALAAFAVVEKRVDTPVLPLNLFRHREFAVVNAATFFVYAGLGAHFVFFNLYLQFLGFSPFEAGLVSLPVSIVLILLASRFGALADRIGPRPFLVAGPLAMAAGLLTFLAFDDTGDLWTVGVAGMVLFSLGLSALVAPITSAALKAAPEELAGVASGVNQTMSRVGGLVATAVVGIVVSAVFTANAGETSAVPFAVDQTDPELRDASVDAFRAAMLVSAGLMVAGALISAFGLPRREVSAAEPGRPEEAFVERPRASDALAPTWCDVDRCDRHRTSTGAEHARESAGART